MIRFEYPFSFVLLLLLPLYFLLNAVQIFRRFRLPLTLSDWGGKSFQYKSIVSQILQGFSTFCVIFAFVCVIFALANPLASHQEKIFTSKGTDIFFVLDTSPSMSARDMDGVSRIDAAKDAIQKLVLEARGSAFGLVTMALEAAVAVPVTLDHDYFFKSLHKTIIGELGDGTALGNGLSLALYHLTNSSAPKKCIILLTDGENNAGSISPLTAARLIGENDIALYILGIGTKGTVPLEYFDPISGKVYSGYFESAFDERKLINLAKTANGSYFSAQTIGLLSDYLTSIAEKQTSVQKYYMNAIDTPLYHYFVFAAFLFTIIAWFIRRFYLREVV